MNTSKIFSSALIAVASLTAASAFAGDFDNYPVQQNTVSTTTRAQVRAEFLQAQRDGTLRVADDTYPAALVAQKSVKSRADVKAELRDAQREGHNVRIDNSYPGDVAVQATVGNQG